MQDEQDQMGLPFQVLEALRLLAQNNPSDKLAEAMGIGQDRVDELLTEIRKMYHTKDEMVAVTQAQKEGMIPRYRASTK